MDVCMYVYYNGFHSYFFYLNHNEWFKQIDGINEQEVEEVNLHRILINEEHQYSLQSVRSKKQKKREQN